MLFSAAISSHNPLLTSMAEPYKDLAIRAVRYQTDREEKRIAFVVGGVAVARTTLIVLVVVPARDGSGSGDGYQNCACHYNFKAGFPRSTVAWSLDQEAGGGEGMVERPRGGGGEGQPARALRGGHR